MKGFLNFIREQGVVGLAVGFLLGGSVSKVVTALIEDIINPILSVVLGAASNFKDSTFDIWTITFKWGDFLSVLIDFAVVAAVVYFGVHALKLDKLDLKKEKE